MPATTFRWFYVVFGLLTVLVLWVIIGYNGLIAVEVNVTTTWSHVEGQYQRRIDLVPNLVSTVKGVAKFEQQTLQGVTEARTKWMEAGTRGDRIAAAGQFDSALSRLIVTAEAYPQLKATEAFRDLMTQLEGTENRIAVARRDYNEAVRAYNLRVKRFPGNILATLFGYEEETFFEADEGAEKAPDVRFDDSL